MRLCDAGKAVREEEKTLSGDWCLIGKETDVLAKLSTEDRQVIDDYITKTNLIAQHECEYLYVQGARDCVELLKKLGVL